MMLNDALFIFVVTCTVEQAHSSLKLGAAKLRTPPFLALLGGHGHHRDLQTSKGRALGGPLGYCGRVTGPSS